MDSIMESDTDNTYDSNYLCYLDPDNSSDDNDTSNLNVLQLRFNDIKETNDLLKQKEEDLVQREIAALKKSEASDLMINYLEEFVKREKTYALQIKEKDQYIQKLEDDVKLKSIEIKRLTDSFAVLRKINISQKEKNDALSQETNNNKTKMKKEISRFENIVNKLNLEMNTLKNENEEAIKKISENKKIVKKKDGSKINESPYRMPSDDHGLSVIYPLLDLAYRLNLCDRVAEDDKFASHPLVAISDDCVVDDGDGGEICERQFLRDKCVKVLPSLINYIVNFPSLPKDICKQSELLLLKFIYRSLLIILPYRYQIGEPIDNELKQCIDKLSKALYFKPCDREKTKKYNFIENFNKEVRLMTYLIILKTMDDDTNTSAVVKRLFEELKSCADMRALFLGQNGPHCLIGLLRPGIHITTRLSLEAISFLSREPLSTPEYLKQISNIDLITQMIILIQEKDLRLILYCLMILFKITKIKENQKLFYMLPLKAALEETSKDNKNSQEPSETMDNLVQTILFQLSELPVPPH